MRVVAAGVVIVGRVGRAVEREYIFRGVFATEASIDEISVSLSWVCDAEELDVRVGLAR